MSFSLDINKRLWADEELFNEYYTSVLMLNKTVIDQIWNTSKFLNYANQLDSIMQRYEIAYTKIMMDVRYQFLNVY